MKIMNFKRFLSLLFLFYSLPIWAASIGLTLEQRIFYQKKVEAVYWQHRIWPKDNLGPKPSLKEILSDANVRLKTEDDLRKNYALNTHWNKSIDAKEIQEEMDRIARETRNPEMLCEIWAALDNDPYVIAGRYLLARFW